jgi:hypothetical protein
MDEKTIKEILGGCVSSPSDGTIHHTKDAIYWNPRKPETIVMEGIFTIEFLEAVVLWTKTHKREWDGKKWVKSKNIEG